MGFSMSMFSAQTMPIAIDFGSSSVKLLQVAPGEPPSMVGAIGLRIPDSIRTVRDLRLDYIEKQLPRMLRKGNFKGRRAVCSIPCADTVVQHMQIAEADGIDRDETIKIQLGEQRGISPYNMVVRSYFVTEIRRDGEVLSEMICFAIARETVMRYVELLRKCKLETVGVHSEVIGMVRAFDYLQPPPDQPSQTNLYVDIGFASTKVAITHDTQLVFARTIGIGGQQIDEKLAGKLGCDEATARAQRTAEHAGGRRRGGAAVASGGPDDEIIEVANAIVDELSMCGRYHSSLFRDRRIDRIIFLGGEARNIALCQQIAKELRLPAQLGDPLTRLECKRSLRTPGLTLGQPNPGWAVACGLCTAPTDL